MKQEKPTLTLSLHDKNGEEVNAIGYRRITVEHLGSPQLFPTAVSSWGLVKYAYLWTSKNPDAPVFQLDLAERRPGIAILTGHTVKIRFKLPPGMAKALRSGKEQKK